MEKEIIGEWARGVNWVSFGVVPLFCGMFGYLFSVLFFEVIITFPFCGLISYQKRKNELKEEEEKKKGREERKEGIKKIQQKFPFWTQFLKGLGTFISPSGWLNAIIMAIILSYSIPNSFQEEQCWGRKVGGEGGEKGEGEEEFFSVFREYFMCGFSSMLLNLPEWGGFIIKFVGLVVVNDFFLYWGHRVQHESEFLWKNFHYFHHQLITPTPVGTVFIHPIDATLQGGIPILLAAIFVQPHPLTFSIFVFCRVAENVANHSGINAYWIEALTLKVLPLRANIKHHDSHHRFSNYSRNAKNYSEAFWVWDYIFGTYRKVNLSNGK